jgi:hypothetical protein
MGGCPAIQPPKCTLHGALGIWGCGWLGRRAAAVQLLLGEQAYCDEVPHSAVQNAATHMRSGNMCEAARQHRAIRSNYRASTGHAAPLSSQYPSSCSTQQVAFLYDLPVY